jgi:hypothetical protein
MTELPVESQYLPSWSSMLGAGGIWGSINHPTAAIHVSACREKKFLPGQETPIIIQECREPSRNYKR